MDQLQNSSENENRINSVEKCFGSSGVLLAAPGRVLIGEGVLTKLCRKKPKERQFFLFNDILVYGTIVVNKKFFKKQQVLQLANIKVENIPDPLEHTSDDEDMVLKNGWIITSPSKSFAVYAQTQSEKVEWMNHMTRCIDKLVNRTLIASATSTTAPTWIPDSEASTCMRCKATRFSTIQRRHHCRKCGYVVCGSCSTKKIKILEQSDKLLRVCDFCFDLQR